MRRHYTFMDKICLGLDQAVRALTDTPKTTGAIYPAKGIEEPILSDEQRKHAAGLMRVNHAGEICAQALYHGQSVVSKTPEIEAHLQAAALEEGDHLAWCKQRLDELNSHPTYLSPFWYMGSFSIGLMAGIIGDQWSLGFVAETERQVIQHLEKHLALLPADDKRSYAILQKMETDEAKHRDEAIESGAHELPGPVKGLMGLASKVMVKTAYWI
ncbi:MAG: 2-polyprenyl-3-methyl-6-methoxy-1,4-benzoquinone monooxygenase [Gammaproteobacteria bacterium]